MRTTTSSALGAGLFDDRADDETMMPTTTTATKTTASDWRAVTSYDRTDTAHRDESRRNTTRCSGYLDVGYLRMAVGARDGARSTDDDDERRASGSIHCPRTRAT